MKSLLHFLSLLCTLATAFAADDAPKKITPEKEWTGSVADQALARTAPGLITSNDAWKGLWTSWKLEGEAPTIDFAKSLVILNTTVGSRLNLSMSLDAKGDLKALAMATRDLRPGFRYVLAQVSLAGVKSVNGKALGEEKAAAGSSIKGKITCAATTEIPQGAKLTLALQDVSRADAAAITLAKVELADLKTFPISYELPFDPAKLPHKVPNFYALSARIEKEGKLLFINDTRIEILDEAGNLKKDVPLPVIVVK